MEEREPLTNLEQVEKQALETAVVAAIMASGHVLKYWPNPANPHFDSNLVMQIFEKNDGIGNYATIADHESENVIKETIMSQNLLKDHSIIGEELYEINTDSEFQWIIDPIDGTLVFRNGMPEFGISIGLLKGQEPIAGVIAIPAYQQLIASRKGCGAELLSFDGKKLAELTNIENPSMSLDKTLVGYDLGYEQRGEHLERTISKLADKVAYPVSYASSSYANFRLCQGQIGAYIHHKPTIFDIAGAAAILPEIGGLVTGLDGKPIDWSAKSWTYLAARNPHIHHALLEIIHG